MVFPVYGNFACVYVNHMYAWYLITAEARRRLRIPWDWNYWQL